MIVAKIPPTDLNALFGTEIDEPETMAGWISPEGDYFRVGVAGHAELAALIVAEPAAWTKLSEARWVHLSEFGGITIAAPHRLTKAQINTLFDIATVVSDSEFADVIIRTLNEG